MALQDPEKWQIRVGLWEASLQQSGPPYFPVHPRPAGGTALPSVPTVPVLQRPLSPAGAAGQVPIVFTSCWDRYVGAPGAEPRPPAEGQMAGSSLPWGSQCVRLQASQVQEEWCRLGMQVCVLPEPRPQYLTALPSRLPPSICALTSSRCGCTEASLPGVAAQPSLAACPHWLSPLALTLEWPHLGESLLPRCLYLMAGAPGKLPQLLKYPCLPPG